MSALTSRRPVIYQALPRLFGNCNPTRRPHGTLEENGCGTFADFSAVALDAIADLGATHLWLTGVIEQASATAYPDRPADPPDILKGLAGSPYAIRDYFDVCPDYAVDPRRRMDEFRALVGRAHRAGLRVLIDFVPNHVSRSYGSDVFPELSFGEGDDPRQFFSPRNNFFYVQPGQAEGGPPLRLPTGGFPGCRGDFAPETDFVRVTGNNAITFAPGLGDWYETVKLNYGHDFTRGRDTSHLPGVEAALGAVPDTWGKMDAVLRHWQELGVDGFRVDMAHMIPMEFWAWAIGRARQRDADVYFFGEAYDNDPAKLTDDNVLDRLLAAGFDSVYDDPAYDLCLGLYDGFDGYKWANDLDELAFRGERTHRALRYAENHDEVRLASPKNWGGLGMAVGRPVSVALMGTTRGPLMIYAGQEVGEPAIGAEGFSGDDGRTSIFDYGAMPEFQKWVHGGRFDGGGLSTAQRELRQWYADWLKCTARPGFTAGDFYGLNHANLHHDAYGRLAGETVSGHWLYAFMRRDLESGEAYLVVVNFHPRESLRRVRIQVPEHALEWLGEVGEQVSFAEVLGPAWQVGVGRESLPSEGLSLPDLEPLSARVLAISWAAAIA